MKNRLGYRQGASILHRFHPLLKGGWLVFITALAFMEKHPLFNLLLALFLLLIFRVIGIRLRDLRGLRLVWITAALIMILQVIFLSDGRVFLELGRMRITDQGILRGLDIGSRFMIVIWVSYLFVLTTSPDELAYSMMKIGLPYRFGFTFVTALRMIPIFETETQTVYRAGQMRGMTYRPRGVQDLWSKLEGFLLPMLISAMSKVDALSISMEGRSFGKYQDRTYFKVRDRFQGDFWAGMALMISIGIVVIWKIWEV